VRVEGRDVATLAHHQLPLLGGLGLRHSRERMGQRPGDSEGGRALEQLASSDLHGMRLH